jgi:hypothetical protein
MFDLEKLGAIIAFVELAFLYVLVPVLFLWAVVGAIVIVWKLWTNPPPPPAAPAGGCTTCVQAQAVYDAMNGWERLASLAYFAAVKVGCAVFGCAFTL